VLCEVIQSKAWANVVVVAPDAGFVKKARLYAQRLEAPLAIADKRRVDHTERAEVLELIGDVAGCTALIVDDFTISAGTLIEAGRLLLARGASAVFAAVTHNLLAEEAVARLDASDIQVLLTTDTIERQPAALSAKTEVVSVAPLFGEAIRRISRRESISVLFQ
jgi:ribose-phosphate pyrophosphokinase